MKIQNQLSRKQLRKQRKLEKKQRIRDYHSGKPHKNSGTPYNVNENIHEIKKKSKINDQFKIKKQQNSSGVGNVTNAKQNQNISNFGKQQKIHPKEQQPQFDSQDERIAMYEQKLGIRGDDKKYNKLAKKMGFDCDLFSFLDNISKTVKQSKESYQMNGENEESWMQYGHEQQLDQDIKEQFDKLNEEHAYQSYEMDEEEKPVLSKKQRNQQSKNSQKQVYKPATQKRNAQKNKQFRQANPQTHKLIESSQQNQEMEVHKKMNSLFNKLSDGNLLFTLRQFISIFQSYPKSITYSTFATLFNKFNLMIEKPLVYVLSANIVIAVSLHRIYGDKLMAQILYTLTQGFEKLGEQQQNVEEIEQIGYSKLFEKKKNFITIACFLYEFASISASFLYTLVSYLAQNINSKDNIEMIYQIIQKCGIKLRNNDPGALKQIIEVIRKMIQDSKKNGAYETTKIKFIQIQINEIRFNKKGLFDADQRMGFLHTFLNKTIKEEAPAEVKTLDVSFDQFRKQIDTSRPDFWMEEGERTGMEDNDNDNDNCRINEQNEEVKALLELAKQMHFVTEVKRNIFVELMSSQDYIQATKRILQLKIKRLEDVAAVLIQVNLQQSTFNPFYSLVAAKLAEEIPKFRVCLQFAIWDRLKQILAFEPRKISNLGKFAGWIVSLQHANSSLTILKYFPDLLNVRSEEDIFLKVFFKELFKKSHKQWISRLAGKLKDEKNKVIRDGIKDYITQLLQNLQSQKQKQNALLLKRLLQVQFEAQIQND